MSSGNFVAELKRRNVYKVEFAYAVVGPFFFPYVNDSRLVGPCQKLNMQVPSASATISEPNL